MNLHLRRILCPTDFSDPSYEALEVARRLAVQFDSEIVLVHVISPVPMLPYAPTVPNFNVPLFLNELAARPGSETPDTPPRRTALPGGRGVR